MLKLPFFSNQLKQELTQGPTRTLSTPSKGGTPMTNYSILEISPPSHPTIREIRFQPQAHEEHTPTLSPPWHPNSLGMDTQTEMDIRGYNL